MQNKIYNQFGNGLDFCGFGAFPDMIVCFVMSQLKLSVHALLLFLAVSMFAVAAEKSVSPVENYAFCSEDSLDYPSGELTITYRVEDADGNLLDKYTEVALLGQVISKVKQIVQDLTEWMLNVDNVLTDIKTPVEQVVESDVYYNLYGQPVSAPQRGIYIKNGRKIFVK